MNALLIICDCGNPIKRPSGRYGRRWDACEACLALDGFSGVERHVIAALRIEPELTIDEIVERTGACHRQISRVTSALLARGRVRRYEDLDVVALARSRQASASTYRYRLTERAA